MIKVATWNLWWRYGDWRARRIAIASELRTLAADVLGLQEVWDAPEANLAEDLARECGYHHVCAPSPNPERFQKRLGDPEVGIGNAILSRWPIVGTGGIRLPAGDAADEGRTALFARIDTPGGTLPFFTTHLNSGWAQSSIRSQQLATVGGLILEHGSGDFPPVFCGDLNAGPDFDEVRALSGKSDPLVPGVSLLDAWWFLNPLEPGWTWDRRNPHVDALNEPSLRIDYIFVGFPGPDRRGRPLTARLFGTQALGGVWPSDHFGVAVELFDEG
jgi:endonuclease/exonuclease/phosphatase family metal-dependent hydrolase